MSLRDQKLTYLRNHVTPGDLWGQLAEEAVELAQAALKMQRLYNGTNLPRKSLSECEAAVTEGHADLDLCLELLDWPDEAKRANIANQKLDRWVSDLGSRLGNSRGPEKKWGEK